MLLAETGSPRSAIQSLHKIVVVGGAYGGVSAIINLLAMADGKELPYGGNPLTGLDVPLKQRLEITLIDERDGFCKPPHPTARSRHCD